ncbi:MAG: HPr(Ser) kinase/phosphatase [Gemmatimonadota bacterium]
MSRNLTLVELIQQRGDALALELLTPDLDTHRVILDSDVSSPGLALAGFTERLADGRMQVMGETEVTYLLSLTPEVRVQRLSGLLREGLPALFVTKDLDLPPEVLEVARRRGVPVLRTALSTGTFFRKLKPFLETALAPSTTLHGSLADVYGVGLLFVGKSGIGKSECVLDLVERGHRLVADDLVMATRRGNDVVLGRGHERQRHHMEIRGVGIIDIQALFGIRATRQQKRIEVVVQLEEWGDPAEHDRTGLEPRTTEILGVSIPKVTIPLNPGKNITVVSEVVAMNHLLKYTGVDSAARFDQSLRDAMRPVRMYLEEDYE